jgi:lactoylglutathione lyase
VTSRPRAARAEDTPPPKTIHFALRVADPDRSIAFYRNLGYELVGTVPSSPIGQLAMLKLPGDEFVTLELVADPGAGTEPAGGNLHHFVIRVASIRDTLVALEARGVGAGPPASPDGSGEMLTAWTSDPDGNRIELVQWPVGHADGITAADFAVAPDT